MVVASLPVSGGSRNHDCPLLDAYIKETDQDHPGRQAPIREEDAKLADQAYCSREELGGLPQEICSPGGGNDQLEASV